MNRLNLAAISSFDKLKNRITTATISANTVPQTYSAMEPYRELVATLSSQARTLATLLNLTSDLDLLPYSMGVDAMRAISELQILKVWADSVELPMRVDLEEEKFVSEFLIQDGKSLTANRIISQILSRATKSLKIVDNYLSGESADIIEDAVDSNIEVQILTTSKNGAKFKSFQKKVLLIKRGWKKSFEVKESEAFHDRYIILDDAEVWLCGPSLDSLGLKSPGVVCKLGDIKESIVEMFDKEWSIAS